VVVVTTPDVHSAAAARAQLLALARLGLPADSAAVVVNRFGRRAELSPRALERACGAAVAAVVDDDPGSGAEFANGRIRPEEWPRRRLRRSLADLAQAVA
jgi:Flp pilus assembly CpaE family ATPase